MRFISLRRALLRCIAELPIGTDIDSLDRLCPSCSITGGCVASSCSAGAEEASAGVLDVTGARNILSAREADASAGVHGGTDTGSVLAGFIVCEGKLGGFGSTSCLGLEPALALCGLDASPLLEAGLSF